MLLPNDNRPEIKMNKYGNTIMEDADGKLYIHIPGYKKTYEYKLKERLARSRHRLQEKIAEFLETLKRDDEHEITYLMAGIRWTTRYITECFTECQEQPNTAQPVNDAIVGGERSEPESAKHEP